MHMTKPIANFKEEFSSKLPALTLLPTLGYEFISPADCESLRGSLLGKSSGQVVLLPIMCEAVNALKLCTCSDKIDKSKPYWTLAQKTIKQQINANSKTIDSISNITVTLSTRKGVAQPWRFFFVCNKVLSGQYV
jgi:hypothetical protein